MPKYTKKDRPARSATNKASRTGGEETCSGDDDVSVCSNVSDATSIYDEIEGVPTTSEIILSTTNLDEKFDAAIEELRNKDLKTREKALKTLQIVLSQKYLPELVDSRREILTETLLNSLKKSSGLEGKLASIVTSLFFVQLGESNDEFYQRFRDVLLPTLRDSTKSSSIRANFAQTIGLICFISSEDINATFELMKIFESIFSKSYLSDDGTSPILVRSEQELHAAALASWCLLFSTMPNNLAHELIRLFAPEKIPGLIESNDAELRNQAGETIAVLYEVAREIGSVFADPPENLLVNLEKKSNESAKYKGKREKRLQRATFREIYNSFEEGTSPEFDIKFGRETLEICSWTSRLYYNSLGGLLGTGMNVHLKENGFVRSVFGLDDREVEQEGPSRGNRFERQLANKTAFKMRTQAMKKTRANKANRREQNIDD